MAVFSINNRTLWTIDDSAGDPCWEIEQSGSSSSDFITIELTAFNSGSGGAYAVKSNSNVIVLGATGTSTKRGIVNLGRGAFDGTTAGFFTGATAGTVVAINHEAGSTADFANWQLQGVQKYKVDIDGIVYLGRKEQFTSGTLDVTPIPGTHSYDGNFYQAKLTTGTSALRAGRGGVINKNITPVGNVGAGEDDLMTYTLPASALNTDKDSVEIHGSFDLAATLNNKRLRCYFGSTIIYDSGNQATSGGVVINARVVRTGAATQISTTWILDEADAFKSRVFYRTPTQTLSSAVVIKFTGTAVATDDISQKYMQVDYTPNI